MKILFCVSKSDKTFFLQQPIETLYTATMLAEQGHEVKILDFRTRQIYREEIEDFPADIIFLVTATYDRSQAISLTLYETARIATYLKQIKPAVPLVAVGTHGSIEPVATARALVDADVILPGELETAVPWLVDAFSQDNTVWQRPLSLNEIPQQCDPATLPIPDYSLVELDKYHGEVIDPETGHMQDNVTGLVFANRGCPYLCAYCHVWFGRKMRYRPASLIVEELAQQVSHGVRDFYFLDYTFSLNHKWVQQLCTGIIERELPVTWTCQTRADTVTAELLTLMRQAGCTGIWYGIESPWIAEADMNKPVSREVIEHCIQMTKEAGIIPFIFILIGLEREDEDIARQLIEWAKQVPAIFSLNPLLARPNTPLWQRHNGPETAQSWEQIASFSLSVGREHYWGEGLVPLHNALAALPNYILNASTNGFPVR